MKINKLRIIFAFVSMLPTVSAMAQTTPYKDTYIREPLVAENTFRSARQESVLPLSFDEARRVLPSPVWEGHDDEIAMYWKAWEIALTNISQPQEGSGFVAPYLSPAYNGNIFMWDCAFITIFSRYGERFFPFRKTLDNFYAKQHPDGFICREIRPDGSDCFGRYDPTSTGPNILPWAEWLYFEQYGDEARLNRVFPALAAYSKWLRLNRTWPNGMYWSSGWGTGMDNMPRVPDGYNTIYSHGHMAWLDASLQAVIADKILLDMGFRLERWQEIEEFEDEMNAVSDYIAAQMWSDADGFLYDQRRDGSLSRTQGIYAYWALHTDVLSEARLDRLAAHLADTAKFFRRHAPASLSASDAHFKPNGRYWLGGVWPGAAYMVISGLKEKGFDALAWKILMNHYGNVLEVFRQTGTFWEYYAPDAAAPGFMARRDFVGWTGLAPIAELLEFIFGIRADVPESKLALDVSLLDAYAVERYPFGDACVNISVAKRTSADERPRVTITSDKPFELELRWNGRVEKIAVPAT